jgi:phosphoenolpyruvate-protein kinase (PTS system EI component)
MIENADPGYDWLFGKAIAGLVTKYGGAASHMAIRCAEFGLPAAIGCGEQIFNELLNSNSILLDCVEQRVEAYGS